MDMLMTNWLGKPAWMWAFFLTIVLVLMVLDLGVLNKKQKVISIRESLLSTLGYAFLALVFCVWVNFELGAKTAMEFLTGYVVEFSLSMDNVFVIAMILGFFKIPGHLQHRVLFWGILGVVLLRGIMIGVGTALVQQYHWVMYLFAVFLLLTGVKMIWMAEKQSDFAHNPLLKFLTKYGRVTSKLYENRFIVRLKDTNTGPNGGKYAWYMTPLLLSFILVVVADTIFAFDSVPAIFAITTDPYIVFTSNIFAILGLRSLYFTLAGLIERFAYLKYALALLLIFIGGKILVVGLLGVPEVSPAFSLSVTFAILASGIGYSLWKTKQA